MRTLHFRLSARLSTVVVVASATVLAACGGGSDGPGDAGGGDAAQTTTTAPPLSPLTGLPFDDPSAATRPVVTVKVDNSPEGRPQSGLDKADVIFEEKVEGGVTRLLAIFHSQDAEEVGPVRSVRSTDVPIVSAVGGIFAYSGGIQPFVNLIKEAPVVAMSQDGGSEGFRQKPGRRRPYATYTSTARLRAAAGDRAKAPSKLLDFTAPGQPFEPAGAAPATTAKVVFGPRTFGDWSYDAAAGHWIRSTNGTPHLIEGAGQLAFTNVIIQKTQYKATQYIDPSGAPVDEAVVVGTGEAVILSQGRQVAATWSKASPAAATTFSVGGAPVTLPPGRTWVSLPPADSPVTVG